MSKKSASKKAIKKSKKAPVKNLPVVMSDDHLGKTVSISCQGADTIDIDSLADFQGKLKILSDEAFEKLKLSIVELGFSFPVAAWKHRNKIFILDAHQRVATLKRMRDEGYFIPNLPVVWVHAKDRHEAAKKLLAATSQYGEVSPDGLYEFMMEFNLSMDEMIESFKFPEINFATFDNSYFAEGKEVSFTAKIGSKELSEGDFQRFDHVCPKCNFQFSDKK